MASGLVDQPWTAWRNRTARPTESVNEGNSILDMRVQETVTGQTLRT